MYFVKQGLFAGGIFKFIIEFPPLYPNQKPQARFLSPLLHPLVDPNSYAINLDVTHNIINLFKVEFKEWVTGKHWVINVLMYIKKLFHVETMFNIAPEQGVEVSNKDMLTMYQKDFSQYIKLCKQCVDKSLDLKFNNHPSSMLKLSEHTPMHDKIVDQIKLMSSEEIDSMEGKEAVKNWFY